MNKFKNIARKACTLLVGAGVALSVALLAPSAPAQPVTPTIYPAVPFMDTNLVTLKTYTNTTVTFPIFRGRGFGFNVGIFSTNLQAGSNLPCFLFQFATPHTNAVYGTKVTNWNTAAPLTFNTYGMSSNQNFWCTNIGPLLVDNFTLGRLYTISNAATSDTKVNGTNTYISVIP